MTARKTKTSQQQTQTTNSLPCETLDHMSVSPSNESCCGCLDVDADADVTVAVDVAVDVADEGVEG